MSTELDLTNFHLPDLTGVDIQPSLTVNIPTNQQKQVIILSNLKFDCHRQLILLQTAFRQSTRASSNFKVETTALNSQNSSEPEIQLPIMLRAAQY